MLSLLVSSSCKLRGKNGEPDDAEVHKVVKKNNKIFGLIQYTDEKLELVHGKPDLLLNAIKCEVGV